MEEGDRRTEQELGGLAQTGGPEGERASEREISGKGGGGGERAEAGFPGSKI